MSYLDALSLCSPASWVVCAVMPVGIWYREKYRVEFNRRYRMSAYGVWYE